MPDKRLGVPAPIAEQDNQQPLGDMTCGQRCVAMALDVAGVWDALPEAERKAANRAFVDEAWQLVNGSQPQNRFGTYFDDERRVIRWGAERFGFETSITAVSTRAELVAAARLGFSVIVAVELGELMSWDRGAHHFVLVISADGLAVKVLDSGRDIDGGGLTNGVYTLDQVVRGGYALMGQGQAFGWAFRYGRR